MTVFVSTDSVPARDRRAFFADAVMQTHFRFNVTFLEGPSLFSASISADQLGPLGITRVVTAAAQVSRTRRLLSYDPAEYVIVGLMRRGTATVSPQNDRETGCDRAT